MSLLCSAEIVPATQIALAGFGTAETMLLLGDNAALDKFRANSSVVVGTDFKVDPLAVLRCRLSLPHAVLPFYLWHTSGGRQGCL